MLSKILLALSVILVGAGIAFMPQLEEAFDGILDMVKVGANSVGKIPPAAEDYHINAKGVKVWNPEALKKYDGSDPSLPLLLVVLGEVFDVSNGAGFYKKGEGYNIFLGQDASASFHSGDWKEAKADVRDMNPQALESVTGWRQFYRTSDKYSTMGVVTGLYYDAEGEPTEALADVSKIEDEAKDAEKYEEGLRKRYPGCNMQSVTALKKTDIQCPARADGTAAVPRILEWKHKGSQAMTKRCACLTMDEIGNPQGLAPTMTSVPYPGCSPTASECSVKY